MWKRWKRLNFCGSGSTLKKEAGIGNKLESIGLFEEPKAFFIKHGASAFSNLATILEIKYNKKDS